MAGACEDAVNRRAGTGLTPARGVLLLVLTLVFVPVLWSAETLRGACVGAPAADRLEVWLGRDDGIVTVRLAGIDADSLREGFHRYATLFTRNRAVGKPVTVEVHTRGAGGEITGRVIVDHRDLSYLIVSEGLARTSAAAPKGMRLLVAEEIARYWARGMWAEDPRVESAAVGPSDLSDIAWQVDRQRAHDPWPRGGTDAVEGVTIDLGSWLDAHESTVIAGWGPPRYIEPGGRGGSVLVYDRCSGPTRAAVDQCRELLYVDRDGRVYRRERDGG